MKCGELVNPRIIILGGARDFHAMDWYHTLSKVISSDEVLFVTDSVASEGLSNMMAPEDKVEYLFVLDRMLFSSQTKIANVWRNTLKIILLPLQVYYLRKIHKKYPDAIFHAHPMYYLFLAWVARIRCGVTPQGSEVLVRPNRSYIYKSFLVRCLRYATFVTVDSVSMKNQIYKMSNVHAVIIQNGIDTGKVLKLSNNNLSKTKICSIRGMTPLYNIDQILRARNNTLPGTGIDFIFPFRDDVYFSMISEQLIDSDRMKGRINKDEMYQYLGECCLTISIPSSDSSPRSVYEAIFAGSYVVLLGNEYLSYLTSCMLKRVIVADLLDVNWLYHAVSFAKQNAHVTYIPSREAIERFDQFLTMRRASKKLYNI